MESTKMADTSKIWIQEIEDILKSEILGDIPAENIRLIVLGEYLNGQGAKLREKFGIPGPKPAEIQKFLDKSLMKEIANEKGIPVARSLILESLPEASVEVLESAVKNYPIFLKPLQGVGAAGSGRVHSAAEFADFCLREAKSGSYIAEEDLNGGTEFWSLGTGSWMNFHHLAVGMLGPSKQNLFDGIMKGTGFFVTGLRPDEAEERLPGIHYFTEMVVNKFKPPSCGVWAVQGYYREWETEKRRFTFVETYFRMPGPQFPKMFLASVGVNLEAVLITANFREQFEKDFFMETSSPVTQRMGQLFFYSKSGIVAQKQTIKLAKELGTSFEMDWKKKEGEAVGKSENLRDCILRVWCSNISLDDLIRDMEDLLNRGHPIN